MAVRPTEISDIIRQQIAGFDDTTSLTNVGTVVSIGDGIANVYGLSNVMASELVEFPSTARRVSPSTWKRTRSASSSWASTQNIEEGDEVRATGQVASVPVGDALIGRVVNALGEPIDGKGPIVDRQAAPIERIAPGVIQRARTSTQPLQTGIKAIDAMIPIGRGQRELIIGDRQTGKTAVALDTIINQQRQRRHLHLRRHRPEAGPGGAGRARARGARRDGHIDRRRRLRGGPRHPAVPRALRRTRHGRGVHGERAARADRLRRPLQARLGLSPGLAADSPPAGPRGVSGRRLLPALAPAGARRAPAATSWAAAR